MISQHAPWSKRQKNDGYRLQMARPSIDWAKGNPYPPRLHISDFVAAGLSDVNHSMQDARNAGLCLTLKGHVQTLHRAIGYLISDLENHAWECRQERIHSFATAKRHRKAIDEAIQRFCRMTSHIPVGDNPERSVRVQARLRFADFYRAFREFLPAVDYANIRPTIGVKTSGEYTWKERLQDAAESLEALTVTLEQLKSDLSAILAEKSRISDDIEATMLKMAGSL